MRQKDLLFLILSSTFLALVWIIFTIIHTSLTSTISNTLTQQIQPINGTFDDKTLQVMQRRLQVTPQFQLQIVDTTTPSPTPTEIPTVPVVKPTGTNATPTVVAVTATPTPTVKPTNTPTP